MLTEIQRYVRNLLPQSVTPARGDRTGALVTISGHSLFSEMTYQGNVWVVNTPANGITATNNNVLGINPIQPIIGFHNTIQSGYILAVHRINSMWCNGTAGQGGLVWGFIAPSCNISTLSDNVEINLATMQTGGSPFKTYTNTIAAGATDAKLLRLLGGPTTGAIGINTNNTYSEECFGDIFCPPGGFLGLFTAAAGSSPIIKASIVFEAIPI